MRPTQHPSNHDVLGAPPGVAIEDCKALPITRARFEDGTPVVCSFWEPNAAELAALAAGASGYCNGHAAALLLHPPRSEGLCRAHRHEQPVNSGSLRRR